MIASSEIVRSKVPLVTQGGECFTDQTLFLVLRRDGDRMNLTEISARRWPKHLPLGRTATSVHCSYVEPFAFEDKTQWNWIELASLADALEKAKAAPGIPQSVVALGRTLTIHRA